MAKAKSGAKVGGKAPPGGAGAKAPGKAAVKSGGKAKVAVKSGGKAKVAAKSGGKMPPPPVKGKSSVIVKSPTVVIGGRKSPPSILKKKTGAKKSAAKKVIFYYDHFTSIFSFILHLYTYLYIRLPLIFCYFILKVTFGGLTKKVSKSLNLWKRLKLQVPIHGRNDFKMPKKLADMTSSEISASVAEIQTRLTNLEPLKAQAEELLKTLSGTPQKDTADRLNLLVSRKKTLLDMKSQAESFLAKSPTSSSASTIAGLKTKRKPTSKLSYDEPVLVDSEEEEDLFTPILGVRVFILFFTYYQERGVMSALSSFFELFP